MKKIAIFVALICICSSLFAVSDRYIKIIKAAKSAEEKENYVYALNYYYEAMEEEPYQGTEAFDGFKNLSDKVRSGNPTGKKLDPFDMNDLWCSIIKNYKQYYTKNNPFVYNFDELTCTSLDYVDKTSDWEISYKTTMLPRYTKIYDILEEGYSNVNHAGWNNIDANWLNDSEIREELDFTIDVLDGAGNLITSAQTVEKVAHFENVNRSNTKILNQNDIKLNLTNVKGKTVVIQTPYKKYRKRVDILDFHDSLKVVLAEDNKDAEDMVLPYFAFEKTFSQEYFDFVMDDYYSWLNKQSLKDSNANNQFTLNYGTALVFCNILSEKFKLKPCYSVNGSTNVYDWALPGKISGVSCNYDASGFRLPETEELSILPVTGRYVSWNEGSSTYNANINLSGLLPVRSDLSMRNELKIRKKMAEDEKNLIEIKLRAEEEEAALLAAEEARLAEEAAALLLAEQQEAELRKKEEKALKRAEAKKKLKKKADDSSRNSVLVRGSMDFNENQLMNMEIYGSLGYHFLFVYGSAEVPDIKYLVEHTQVIENLSAQDLNYVFGGGINISLNDVLNGYIFAGSNFFEETFANQNIKYGIGIDLLPFERGLDINAEIGASYYLKSGEYVPRLTVGLGALF